jgi:hypothetical protein
MSIVTVVATRNPGLSLPEMELLVGSVIVLALLTWSLLSTLRHRDRQPRV